MGDKGRLWNVALGSAAEIMSEFDIAIRLGYPAQDEAKALSEEYDQIAAMLSTLTERFDATTESNCRLPTAIYC